MHAGAATPAPGYGPGDVLVAHSARECVPLRELAELARALVLTVRRATEAWWARRTSGSPPPGVRYVARHA
ncbi:hypothetical protein ACWDXT_14340 [Streptomyces sp. NPDC003236]